MTSWVRLHRLLAECAGAVRRAHGVYPFFKRTPVASFEQLKQAAARFSFERLVLAYFAVGPASDLLAGFIEEEAAYQLSPTLTAFRLRS